MKMEHPQRRSGFGNCSPSTRCNCARPRVAGQLLTAWLPNIGKARWDATIDEPLLVTAAESVLDQPDLWIASTFSKSTGL